MNGYEDDIQKLEKIANDILNNIGDVLYSTYQFEEYCDNQRNMIGRQMVASLEDSISTIQGLQKQSMESVTEIVAHLREIITTRSEYFDSSAGKLQDGPPCQ